MNTNLKSRYKADTGESAYLNIESSPVTTGIDYIIFRNMSKSQIISALEYDLNHNTKWGIHIEQLPTEFHDGDDLSIYTPEYVRWLEDQLLALEQKNQQNLIG